MIKRGEFSIWSGKCISFYPNRFLIMVDVFHNIYFLFWKVFVIFANVN